MTELWVPRECLHEGGRQRGTVGSRTMAVCVPSVTWVKLLTTPRLVTNVASYMRRVALQVVGKSMLTIGRLQRVKERMFRPADFPRAAATAIG